MHKAFQLELILGLVQIWIRRWNGGQLGRHEPGSGKIENPAKIAVIKGLLRSLNMVDRLIDRILFEDNIFALEVL